MGCTPCPVGRSALHPSLAFARQLALDEGILATRIFPGSAKLASMEGLVRSPASAV